MIEATLLSNEAQRLRTLRGLDILDTPPEDRFDRLTSAASRAFGVPMALISLVDEDRQWFKSKVGVDKPETPRSISFCGHAIHQDEIFEVEDATLDPRFADNPLVTGDPHVRFYAGQPLYGLDGSKLGTFCIMDRVPRRLSPRQREALKELAEMAEDEINAHRVTLGDYRLLEVVGRGGMGVVYRAREESLEREVALKVIHRQNVASPEFREHFRREARSLAAINHPNVMTVHRVGEHAGAEYLVFELLHGGTLSKRIRERGKLSCAEAASIVVPVARGLAAVHDAGLVHRDVKPANILFDGYGTPKLGDFGLARTMGARGARSLAHSLAGSNGGQGERIEVEDGRTHSADDGDTDFGLGTPGFVAPETLTDRHSDPRSDLYGLGATVFASLTGTAPPDPTAAMSDGADPWLDRIRAGLALSEATCPGPLRDLVLTLLELDPQKRPHAAHEVAAALAAASGT